MKKLFVLAGIVSLLFAAPALAQEETVGDYASLIAATQAVDMPPGLFGHVAQRANNWFSQVPFAPTIFADDLARAMESLTPPFVVDVRDAASYANGHVPGAINIPLATLFRPTSLALLPANGQKIVLVCVTGHTASLGASVLGVLGYNVSVLRFGFMGWNSTTKMRFFSAGASEVPQTVLGYSSLFAVGAKPIACGPLPYGVCQ